MTGRGAYLAAELDGWPDASRLADILRDGGLAVRVGRYSVRLDGFDAFAFRELGGDLSGGSVDACHDSLPALLAVSRRVSDALAKAKVRHRFEIYSDAGECAARLHFDWPRGA